MLSFAKRTIGKINTETTVTIKSHLGGDRNQVKELGKEIRLLKVYSERKKMNIEKLG